jgi:hypothetical protein
MMTPRDVVRAAVAFERPDRLPRSFPEPYGNDFCGAGMNPSPDARPNGTGVDEWGAVWHNIGVCKLGEVKKPPLLTWDDFDDLNIPDVEAPKRWQHLDGVREKAGDRYLLCSGISLYERVHFVRGLENTWTDIYTNPAELQHLIGILVDMNLKAIEHYGRLGGDGFIFCDDWGLQDRLMISPEKWREIWKPAYRRVYDAAHRSGMQTFLHSCGFIIDILPDLIDIGLDVIQMDQQENMGLDALHRFAGKIAFWCPVDIQTVMCDGNEQEIRAYCKRLVDKLGTPAGGFLPKWYGDPEGAGHSQQAVKAMCNEFLKIGG